MRGVDRTKIILRPIEAISILGVEVNNKPFLATYNNLVLKELLESSPSKWVVNHVIKFKQD